MASAQPLAFYNAPIRLFSTEGDATESDGESEAAE